MQPDAFGCTLDASLVMAGKKGMLVPMGRNCCSFRSVRDPPVDVVACCIPCLLRNAVPMPWQLLLLAHMELPTNGFVVFAVCCNTNHVIYRLS